MNENEHDETRRVYRMISSHKVYINTIHLHRLEMCCVWSICVRSRVELHQSLQIRCSRELPVELNRLMEGECVGKNNETIKDIVRGLLTLEAHQCRCRFQQRLIE